MSVNARKNSAAPISFGVGIELGLPEFAAGNWDGRVWAVVMAVPEEPVNEARGLA